MWTQVESLCTMDRELSRTLDVHGANGIAGTSTLTNRPLLSRD